MVSSGTQPGWPSPEAPARPPGRGGSACAWCAGGGPRRPPGLRLDLRLGRQYRRSGGSDAGWWSLETNAARRVRPAARVADGPRNGGSRAAASYAPQRRRREAAERTHTVELTTLAVNVIVAVKNGPPGMWRALASPGPPRAHRPVRELTAVDRRHDVRLSGTRGARLAAGAAPSWTLSSPSSSSWPGSPRCSRPVCDSPGRIRDADRRPSLLARQPCAAG